ncbi:MAG: helix-turn-helix transcriptional regulator [Dehalococcoidia bacterium]|nr:helix-turn-helix transcriptional regulator [Dehalococcoidia bacterium]
MPPSTPHPAQVDRTEHADGELTPFCPRFHHAVELVGRRWTGAILRAMLAGCVRFSDLAAAVPGLSDRLLSERLKELTSEGLIERVTLDAGAGRVEYRLTDKGRQLTPVIESLSSWAEAWIPLDASSAAGASEARDAARA